MRFTLPPSYGNVGTSRVIALLTRGSMFRAQPRTLGILLTTGETTKATLGSMRDAESPLDYAIFATEDGACTFVWLERTDRKRCIRSGRRQGIVGRYIGHGESRRELVVM